MEESVGAFFGLADSPCLLAQPIRDGRFSVTRLRCRLKPEAGQLVSLPPDDAYFLMLYLKDAYHRDLASDGSESEIRRYRQGTICLVDLAHGASIRLSSDLDSLAFYVPRTLFREVAEFSEAPKAARLRCRRGEEDDIMRNLGDAILPLFEARGTAHLAVLQHIAIAICAHLLHSYGEAPTDGDAPSTGLTVWQEKAAKDFIIDHFSDDISMAAAASAAGMPIDDFSRGFKDVTGHTPHQWLMRYRIGRAKQYLSEHLLPLQDVASRCGFADENQFAKVFTRATGHTPSAWRARWLQ
ncbi:helix-turn-helix transcriptional regulator (plasmid) [Sinorhizobium sp. BG8]|nr:helix-turn-helix transcriptional regulator [Sinorhizobium sp. BG8]